MASAMKDVTWRTSKVIYFIASPSEETIYALVVVKAMIKGEISKKETTPSSFRRSASKKLPETDVAENWKFAQPYPCKSVFWSSFHG